jgi:hypothetical protein
VQVIIIILEPCALNAEFHRISYLDLVKFHYFINTTERREGLGVKGGPQERLKIG